MSTTSFIRVRGRQVEYQQFEPTCARPGSAPLVMLHEGLGSVSMWKDFPQLLADATGARVVAYSRPGHGRSEPLAIPDTAVQMHEREALQVLPEVLRALRIERPVLFGHSDGASIGLIFAGVHPGDVAGLIVLAPHVFVEEMCLASIQGVTNDYPTSDLRGKLGRYHDDPDRVFRGWSGVWLDPAFRAWNIERHLAAIRCPVLAIQGYEDEYGTMAQLDRLERQLRQMTALKLADCRHSPHRDSTAEVLAAAQSFLAAVDRSAG